MKSPLFDIGPNDKAGEILTIRFLFSKAAGSDESVIELIQECITERITFGLKCDRSAIVYDPSKLRAYWVSSHIEDYFTYPDMTRFIQGVSMQYLSHKTLIVGDDLLKLLPQKFQSRALPPPLKRKRKRGRGV